ncbi:MGDG synthase family glycosyltransferase [Caldinitratiruptor microaerophilus]|uniref:Galactosyldiacylglycerol synthase n=1 Tax=Caldinitratiruptor microaerophilus TaxID=671077 RepID=A0AA35G874_9FIRM|nr:glycosyltransferase [Caldinitratiruptor microaerophilus]BDG60710.1 galactosyldiacylglycerol synthase [Caldinitratiruptor microaerophilus]
MTRGPVPRVLVLSARFGSGHTQAARAVAAAVGRLRPGALVVVRELGTRPATRGERLLPAVADVYLRLLRWTPGSYGWLYRQTATASDARGAGDVASWLLGPAIREAVRSVRPDVVLATHPFPGLAVAHLRWRGELGVPAAVVLTDFWPHPAWIHPGYDRFFVASASTARALFGRGVPPGRVAVTGIPIGEAFWAGSPGGLRRGCAADAPGRVLVMGGSLGIGPLEAVSRFLLRLDPPPAVTVVAGQDRRAAARLRGLAADHPRLEVHGYTPDVASLMAWADLLVTKAGGLTCSEALAVGLPMVLLRPLPGHEEDNAAHLTRLGAAIQARTPGQAAALARYLLVDAPGRRERMGEAARAAGRPRAALAVAGRVLALAGHVVLPDTVRA